tara:strand:- start:523 stop:678 length:156 start_codon:yes stop_codon:yes gene_type:complete
MTMRDPSAPRETLAEVQRMLARARPDQIERLMADIMALDTRRDESPERRAS